MRIRKKVDPESLSPEDKEKWLKKKEYLREYYRQNKGRLNKKNKMAYKKRINKKVKSHKEVCISIGEKSITMYTLQKILDSMEITRRTYIEMEMSGIVPKPLFTRQGTRKDRLYTKEQLEILAFLGKKYKIGRPNKSNRTGFKLAIFPIWRDLHKKYTNGDYSNC